MDELVKWLGEQLDKDERIARAASARSADWLDAGTWRLEGVEHAVVGDEEAFCHPHNAPHIAEHDPARVLREIDAKRRIAAQMTSTLSCADGDSEVDHYGALADAEDTLRLLALPYADRPGYREEWRP